MTTKINRESFLRQLESVRPGLSSKDIVEQSSCLVFMNGQVFSYNDEIAVRAPSLLSEDIKGAVDSKPLLELLAKLSEEEIEVEPGEGVIVVRGKGRKAGIRMEAEIVLPFGSVDQPKQWSPLPEDFSEALKITAQCSKKGSSDFRATCVHFHPKWLEACDDTQMVRYRIVTGVEQPTLVRGESVKAVAQMKAIEFSETESWLHFRNHAETILSIRRYMDEFPSDSVTECIKTTQGEPMNLPKGLIEAADKAAIFAGDDPQDAKVMVRLEAGRLRLEGQGARGWYVEPKKVNYNGPPISFLISPTLLIDLVTAHNDIKITPDKIRIENGKKMVYILALGMSEQTQGEGE